MPSVRFLRISDEALVLLERLAAAAGKSREAVLEELVRTAAEAEGLAPPPRDPVRPSRRPRQCMGEGSPAGQGLGKVTEEAT